MWVPVMEALAGAGRRCVAPDLYGLGDSTDDEPATFEHNLEALRRADRRARPRARRARRPRLGRVRRPRLGLRAPGRGRGAGDQRHRLLQRRQVARDGRGDPRRAGRADRRRDRSRRVRRRCCARRRRLRRRGHRRLLAAVRGRAAASGRRSTSTARWTSTSSSPTRAGSASSACRRCSCGAPRTRSRRSPPRSASSARSRARSWSRSRAPGTSSSTSSRSAAPTRSSNFLAGSGSSRAMLTRTTCRRRRSGSGPGRRAGGRSRARARTPGSAPVSCGRQRILEAPASRDLAEDRDIVAPDPDQPLAAAVADAVRGELVDRERRRRRGVSRSMPGGVGVRRRRSAGRAPGRRTSNGRSSDSSAGAGGRVASSGLAARTRGARYESLGVVSPCSTTTGGFGARPRARPVEPRDVVGTEQREVRGLGKGEVEQRLVVVALGQLGGAATRARPARRCPASCPSSWRSATNSRHTGMIQAGLRPSAAMSTNSTDRRRRRARPAGGGSCARRARPASARRRRRHHG